MGGSAADIRRPSVVWARLRPRVEVCGTIGTASRASSAWGGGVIDAGEAADLRQHLERHLTSVANKPVTGRPALRRPTAVPSKAVYMSVGGPAAEKRRCRGTR